MDVYSEVLSPLLQRGLRLGSFLDYFSHFHPRSSPTTIEGPKVNKMEKDFNLRLDVQQFKPDELKVKVVDDFIVVTANHKERLDEHGYVSREFVRRVKIPEDIDSNSVTVTLSSDGVLTLMASPKKDSSSTERKVPIVTESTSPVIKQADKRRKLEED